MSRRHFVLISLAGLACFVALILRKGRRRSIRGEWPVNLAHRGASDMAPENTIEAFRLAVEAGAGGLELDVHMTRDGHIVVIHDATVDRTTSGSGAVSEMTLHELRKLDAGHNFRPHGGPTRPYRGRGVRVPTLGEVLEEFPGVAVNIDIKAGTPGIEETVFGVLREADALRRAIVVSTPHATVKRFRKVSGGHISTGGVEVGDRDFLPSEQTPSGASRAPGLRRAAGSPQAQRNIGGDPALRQGGACQGREGGRVDHKPG